METPSPPSIYELFIHYENHTQSTVTKKKRLEIHWSMLKAHWARQKAILYFMEFTSLSATVESFVMDLIGLHCINVFLLSLNV